MIANETIDRIQKLLGKSAFSQRKIARLVGVSRGTVSSVADGRRKKLPQDYCDDELTGFPLPHGEFTRCSQCGGMVQMPCLFCQIQEWLKSEETMSK